MEEYLKKYIKKNEKNCRKKKNIKKISIHDSEDETNEKKILKDETKNDEENEDVHDPLELVSSDEDIPITVTNAGSSEVIELSNEKKKIILDSLNKSGKILLGKKEHDEKRKYQLDSKEIKSRRKNEHSETDNNKLKKNRKTNDTQKYNESYSDSDMSLPRRTRHEHGNADSSEPQYETESDGDEKREREDKRKKGRKRSNSSTFSKSASSSNLEEKNFIYYANESDEKIYTNMNKTVYRDEHGNIISREEWIKKQKEKMKNRDIRKKKTTEHKELEWASGLAQKEMKENIFKENERIIKKRNIVNYDFDPDYDEILRNRRREEDPMNIYLKKEEKKNEKDEKPTCPFQTPYNRFNISAGYRWDGIIRGNGYEQKRYQAIKMNQERSKTDYMNSSYGI